MTDPKNPVLWHLPVSHYSEKVRWALALKGVEHERKAPPPGAHMLVAMALTRSTHHTFPVLRLDGRSVGDSAAIIDALERRYPEPALYPADQDALDRALELQRFFDTELGPHIRLYAWHELRRDPERMAQLSATIMPGRLARWAPARRAATGFASTFVQLRFRVASPEAAQAAGEKVIAALDRLEAELEANGGDYLVGDSFTVADLTAASLFYPLVDPPEGPKVLPDAPEAIERFRAPLADRRGYRWVAEMFARHRHPA
jgi:glutathione S-transferase